MPIEHAIVRAGDAPSFRTVASVLLAHRVPPDAIEWVCSPCLVAGALMLEDPSLTQSRAAAFLVPVSFLRLADLASLHRHAGCHAVLYAALWRMVHQAAAKGARRDPDMSAVLSMAQAVRRDIASLKRRLLIESAPRDASGVHCAWASPSHRVLETVARWRHARQPLEAWIMATPDQSIGCRAGSMHYAAGVPDAPTELQWAALLAVHFPEAVA